MPAFLVGTCLVTSTLMMDSFVYPKKLAFVTLSVILATFVILTRRQIIVDKRWMTASVTLLLVYIFVRNLNRFNFDCVCLMGALLFLIALSQYEISEVCLAITIELLVAAMAVMCLLQAFGFESHNGGLPLTASFENPTGLASLMVSFFPFVIKRFLQTRGKTDLAILSLLLLILLLMQSRSGILSVIVVIAIMMSAKEKHLYRRAIFPAIFILGGSFVFLLCIKSDSTFGHLFIFGVSIPLMLKNSFLGGGFHTFTANYMEVQANYFATHSDDKLSWLADNPSHPLCEYVSFLMQNGLVGVFILCICIGIFISHWYRHGMSIWHLCLVAIAVFSFFNYSFRYPHIWFFALLSISQLTKSCPEELELKTVAIYVLLFFTLATLLLMAKDVCFEYKWRLEWGKREKNLTAYRRLHARWNGNPYFLYNYAALLHHEFEYEESNILLGKYIHYVDDYYTQLLLAENHYARADYKKSIMHYLKAHQMCPNRFKPLQGMLRAYQKTGCHGMAYKTAKEIMGKREKVKSYTVSVIKAEAKKYLDDERK